MSHPSEASELWPITAMRDRGIALEVVDTRLMTVTFANGVVLPIIALFDAEGWPVDDWEDAVKYDFGNPYVGYGSAVINGSRPQIQ